MIGRIHGLLLDKQPPDLLVDLNGVGYELQAPLSTFFQLPEIGHSVTLYTHLTVREDAHQLFGFAHQRERQLFRTLLKVNGVGPKLALCILSNLEPDVFVTCIAIKDEAALSKIPGIGKKTAQRLIVEMRDRLEDWQIHDTLTSSSSSGATATTTKNNATSEAVSALIALGYRPQEASRAIAKVDAPGMLTEELIRQALRICVS